MNKKLDFSTLDLVGRQDQILSLKRSFRRVAAAAACSSDNNTEKNTSPSVETIFVSGSSGCGKSSLVEYALKTECHAVGGWMVTGKFDRGARIASNGLDQAMSNLVDLVWSSPEGAEFRSELLKQIGDECQTLAKRIPALDTILNTDDASSKPLKRKDDNEYAIARLKTLYRLLLRSIQKICKRPIVLFFDDLQFIDEDNVLDLLKFVIADPEATGILFVSSYRHDEIGESVSAMLSNLQSLSEILVTCVQISNFEPAEIAKLLQRLTKNTEEERLLPLAELVHQRTGGNPMFVREFIKSLEQQELLYYSLKTFEYDWDVEGIKKTTQVTANVCDFIASKIDDLPKNAIKSLKFAGCLGFMFQVQACELASSIMRGEDIDVKKNLEFAAEIGLIERLDDGEGHWYKFSHDSIKEAIISLIKDPGEMESIYWRNGLALKKLMDSGVNSKDSIMSSVFLLNKGRSFACSDTVDEIRSLT